MGARGMAVLIAGTLACAAAAIAFGWADDEAEMVIGVVPQLQLEPGEGERVREGGIQSVRFWLPWSAVEVTPGEYDWSSVDPIVEEIASAGMTPFPFLFGSPEWAARRDQFDCAGADCITFAPATVETREAFARFAAAAVRRYGPGGSFWADDPSVPDHPIRAWQIWNEPNLEAFWRPDVDASDYAEVLRLVAENIRDADPDADIVLAGLSGDRSNVTRESTTAFLRDFYAVPEIQDSFEGIAVHPYSSEPEGVFGLIEAARAVAAEYDSDFDVWITEVGWASSGDERQSLVKDLDGQAERLSALFGTLLDRAEEWDVRGAYWYAWRDTEPGVEICSWCPGAGLVDSEGAAKPAYDELRELAAQR